MLENNCAKENPFGEANSCSGSPEFTRALSKELANCVVHQSLNLASATRQVESIIKCRWCMYSKEGECNTCLPSLHIVRPVLKLYCDANHCPTSSCLSYQDLYKLAVLRGLGFVAYWHNWSYSPPPLREECKLCLNNIAFIRFRYICVINPLAPELFFF